MNKFKKIMAAGFVAGATLMAAGQGAFAAETAISPGSLGMTQPTISNFNGVTLNGTIQTSHANVGAFTVTDATGNGSGWRVDVQASQFTNTDATRTLPLNSLNLAAPTVVARDGADDISTITTATGDIDTSTGVKILSAAVEGGMGTYDVSFPQNALSLELQPKDVKAGTYSSTITVAITTGP